MPDPKSQVEQITIALIYKFMDDMDLESEEMGGVRSFLTGEYERYAWSKLVAPGVGGQEMLNTYTEALAKMVGNSGIPELFRAIFRNAYLPYRDSETLRSFLREINGFSYDHSERLGDAFEYLLSVLGSQGDAGQFRTPRHIIDFMVEIIDPKKEEVILDPACGTAGFLISSYKHILKANSTEAERDSGPQAEVDAAEAALESPLRFSGDLLTPEDRQRLANQIKGYDISPDMVRLSLVNLYLHGFADPKCEEYDTLTSEDKWGQTADVILANPPFMSPKGGIKPHNRFGVPSKRSEVLFVDYIAEHLTPSGRAAIVVPEGIIFQSQSAYVALRKMLVTKHLAAVISLPAGVFNPYSGVKTSILILDRAVAKASDSVAFFKIENDGFGLGAQRRAVKGGQLGQVKAELGAWLAAVRSGGEAVLETPLGFAVEKARIAEGGEYNLSGELYRETTELTSRIWPVEKMGDLCTSISDGDHQPPPKCEEGVPFITIANLDEASGVDFDKTYFVSRDYFDALKDHRKPRLGDILYSVTGSYGISVLVQVDRPFCLQRHIALFRPSARVLPSYLLAILRSPFGKQQADAAASGVAQKTVSLTALREFQIPLPPLEVQREIVAEIDGYQKVIDGARTVLENYRPHIPIDPAWPILTLGETCERIMDGTHFSPSNSSEGERLYITSKNVRDGYLDLSNVSYISEEEHRDIFRRCPVQLGDVLYTKDGSNTGLSAINTLTEEFSLLSSVAVLRGKLEVLDNRYLSYYLNSGHGRQRMLSMVSGVAITRLTLTKIGNAEIPLPPLETQQVIVAEIEAEQALVAANRELITHFEKKIEAAIARVWGGAEEDH